jgi:leucyl aminopeptidase
VISFQPTAKFDKDAVVISLTTEQVKDEKYPFPQRALQHELKKAVAAGQFDGAKGQMFPLVMGKQVVLFLGLGKEADLTLTGLRIALRSAFLSANLKKARTVEVILHAKKETVAKAAVEAAVIGTYVWKKYLTKKKDDKSVEKKDYVIAGGDGRALAGAIAVAESVNFARDLVNENADVTTAVFLEKKVRELIRGKKNVSIEVLDRKKLVAKKLGLLLAVNQGSSKEPRVVIVRYNGAGKNTPYTALVGKGLTFDTGGLNLKPSGHIEDMRCDMSGAAAVWATLKVVLALKPKRNLLFAAGMVENAISANAYKPGDVITGYSGKTVEISNTDAEGRLVLADVLAYVIKNYKPARVIDLATLTGACRVALGNDYAGLISNNDELAADILASAAATDDRLWRLPNYPEIWDSMKSKIADIKNTSNTKGAGGTLTGAEFLRQFVGDTPWAHLDIAATAYADGGRWYYGHGATGFGVRLLSHYILNH